MNAKQLRRFGTLVLAFFATLILALFILSVYQAHAQTVPPATSKLNITIIGAGTATLYRADTSCGSAQSFAQVGTLSSAGSFTDTQPSDGKAHCYYAVLPVNVPTNEIEWVTPTPATVSVKTLGQELSAVTQ